MNRTAEVRRFTHLCRAWQRSPDGRAWRHEIYGGWMTERAALAFIAWAAREGWLCPRLVELQAGRLLRRWHSEPLPEEECAGK